MLFHVNRRFIQLYYVLRHRIVFEKLCVFSKNIHIPNELKY